MLRVKRDSLYLSKNNDVNKNNTIPSCVLVCLADTQQTVTLMRKMWARQTVVGETRIARVSPTTTLCSAGFFYHGNAFQLSQTQAVVSFQEHRIQYVYTELTIEKYTNISNNSRTTQRMPQVENISRNLRQGYTISPKLFKATLESIFRGLN